MWEILLEGMLGFSMGIDSTRPESFSEERSILETFRAYAPTSYGVAANKQDWADAWNVDHIRLALHLDPKVKILPCVAKNKETVKAILLELLYCILAKIEAGGEACTNRIQNKPLWLAQRNGGSRYTSHETELTPIEPTLEDAYLLGITSCFLSS